MSIHSHVLSPSPAMAPIEMNGDLRRHRRVPLELAGRFMRSNRAEHLCQLRDVSVGGAFVAADAEVDLGEPLIAYFEDLGGIEGNVTRRMPNGFAFRFRISERKREKLAAQIMWILNRPDFPDELGRQHDRASVRGRRTTLRFDDGMLIDVDLIDLSVAGASIRTPARPAIGEEVLLGKVRAVVRRHHPDGVGVQFYSVLDRVALKAHFT